MATSGRIPVHESKQSHMIAPAPAGDRRRIPGGNSEAESVQQIGERPPSHPTRRAERALHPSGEDPGECSSWRRSGRAAGASTEPEADPAAGHTTGERPHQGAEPSNEATGRRVHPERSPKRQQCSRRSSTGAAVQGDRSGSRRRTKAAAGGEDPQGQQARKPSGHRRRIPGREPARQQAWRS